MIVRETLSFYQHTVEHIYSEESNQAYINRILMHEEFNNLQRILMNEQLEQKEEKNRREMEHVIRTTYMESAASAATNASAETVVASSPVGNTQTMETLVKMVGAYEQDQCPRSGNAFQASLLDLSTELKPRCDLILARMRGLDHAQRNAFEDITIEERELVYFVAMAQSCKTGSIIFSVWKAGILRNMPSVMMSFNRLGETDKFARAAASFNEIVKKCAVAMGLSDEKVNSVPVVGVFTEKESSSKLYGKAVGKMGEMRNRKDFSGSYEIPLMVVMTNPKKIQTLRKSLKHLSKTMGVDSDGAMKALLIMDEAELTIKAGKKVRNSSGEFDNVCASLEKEMNTTVELRQPTPVRHGEMGGYIPRTMPSMCEAFTSILRVTATPHAFAYKTEKTTKGRIMVLAEPSRNYWTFRKSSHWDCKLITRMEASSSSDMTDEMVKQGLGNRHGMVMVSKGSESTSMTNRQREMAKDCAKRYKEGGSPLVSVAWDGKGVNVYTSCDDVIRKLTLNATYTSVQSVGVKHFKSQKSYPEFMSDMVVLQETTLPSLKTVLYSYCMSGRSTPIKSVEHKLPLTDIYVDLSGQGGHDEAIIQAVGRLNGIDERPQSMGKFVWGTNSVLNHLYKIVGEVPYYVDKIRNGCNITTALLDVASDASSERMGGSVDDDEGCSMLTHGKRTRPGICTEAKIAEKEMRAVFKKRKVTPVAPVYDNTYENVVEMGVVTNPGVAVGHGPVENRLINLLNTAPDRTMSIGQIRIVDPTLGGEIESSHNRITAELVDLGILERTDRGVFRLVQPLDN